LALSFYDFHALFFLAAEAKGFSIDVPTPSPAISPENPRGYRGISPLIPGDLVHDPRRTFEVDVATSNGSAVGRRQKILRRRRRFLYWNLHAPLDDGASSPQKARFIRCSTSFSAVPRQQLTRGERNILLIRCSTEKHRLRRPNSGLRERPETSRCTNPYSVWRRCSPLFLSAAALLLLCWSLAGFEWGVGVYRAPGRIVGHCIKLAIPHVHPLHLLPIEGARPATSKH